MPETQKHKFQTAVSLVKHEHLVSNKLMRVKFSPYRGDEAVLTSVSPSSDLEA